MASVLGRERSMWDGMAEPVKRLRSQDWFDNEDRLDMTALYLEHFMNFGIRPEELRVGRPIIAVV